MLALAKMLSRRSMYIFVALGMFLGTLLLVSSRLNDACPGGRLCPPDMSSIREKFSGLHPNKNDNKHETSSSTDHDETATLSSSQSTSKPSSMSASEPANPTPNLNSDQPPKHNPKTDPECANFPDTSNVLVIMKTGASEAYGKIPTQVLTNARCLPEFFIFSDMDQHIAGYHIRDSLDNVTTEIKADNKDFEIYFHQQECHVDQSSCNKKYDVAKKGWALDKYKNVHIAEKTWKLRPNYDWYLYTDADTYVVWSTMVEWLKTLDPTKPQYLGSVALLGGFPFGHGGSGYLVSQAAMRKMFDDKENVANQYDKDAKGTCCGDFVFAKALKDQTGVGVKNVWPTINGEKPHTLPYNDGSWCQPIATMHHVGSEELSDLDAFERARNFTTPVRIKDLYEHFVKNQLSAERDEWDNMSDDRFYLNPKKKYEDWIADRAEKPKTEEERNAYKSFDDCKIACESLDYCLQFKFDSGYCAMTNKFKHGKPLPREKPTDGSCKSGWDLRKIEMWVDDHKECDGFDWPNPNK